MRLSEEERKLQDTPRVRIENPLSRFATPRVYVNINISSCHNPFSEVTDFQTLDFQLQTRAFGLRRFRLRRTRVTSVTRQANVKIERVPLWGGRGDASPSA